LSTTYNLIIDKPRPYFAELPYALWGEVNYDSEGDCKRPTDQEWNGLELTNRDTKQHLAISSSKNEFEITSEDPLLAAQASVFLIERCSAGVLGEDPRSNIGSWTYTQAFSQTARIRAEFPRPELKPFDHDYFWGSWKWVGWFGTSFTWVGRWIMNSLLTKDKRAVCLCVDWLKAPPSAPLQSVALRYALEAFTGLNFKTDKEWIKWYKGGLFRTGGNRQYPKPDFDAWLADLKRG
jgi:hypothetical protein